MRLLLDTNALLWAMSNAPRITPVRDLLLDAGNDVFVSTVSWWEIAIKARIGKISADVRELRAAAAQRRVRMRVWERGAGETLACGTGACAVAVACCLNGLTENDIEVELKGGVLRVRWEAAVPRFSPWACRGTAAACVITNHAGGGLFRHGAADFTPCPVQVLSMP